MLGLSKLSTSWLDHQPTARPPGLAPILHRRYAARFRCWMNTKPAYHAFQSGCARRAGPFLGLSSPGTHRGLEPLLNDGFGFAQQHRNVLSTMQAVADKKGDDHDVSCSRHLVAISNA